MKLASLVVLGACAAAIPSAAAAAVTVIGNSAARLCYESAELDRSSVRTGLEHCNVALTQDMLNEHDRVASHVNRGILRTRSGDTAGAIGDFDRALQLDPDEPEAYLNKALVLAIKEGKAGQALPLFTTALEKKTKRPELAYFGRGAAYEDLGDLRSALSAYRSAAELAPKWELARTELARFSIRR